MNETENRPLSSFKFKGEDGKGIATYVWNNVEHIHGVVQIFHGMAEHAQRYDHFARFLNSNGFIVYANDHRGHGKTAEDMGRTGIICKDGFHLIVEDEYILFKIITQKYSDLPVFILGHSFGSFVAQEFITLHGSEIAGVILTGSALQSGMDVTLGRILASLQRKIFGEDKKSYLIDKLAFGTYNKKIPNAQYKFSWLSTDEAEVVKYEKDPLCGEVFSIGFYYYFFRGLKNLYLQKKLVSIPHKLPVYILSGEEDPVGYYGKRVQKLYDLYRKYGLENIQMKLYPGKRHEILNEADRLEVYNDILVWIDRGRFSVSP